MPTKRVKRDPTQNNYDAGICHNQPIPLIPVSSYINPFAFQGFPHPGLNVQYPFFPQMVPCPQNFGNQNLSTNTQTYNNNYWLNLSMANPFWFNTWGGCYGNMQSKHNA